MRGEPLSDGRGTTKKKKAGGEGIGGEMERGEGEKGRRGVGQKERKKETEKTKSNQ